MENEDIKNLIRDILNMIPTDKEAQEYVKGAYGYEYDEHASYQENAFVNGCDWMRDRLKEKLESLK